MDKLLAHRTRPSRYRRYSLLVTVVDPGTSIAALPGLGRVTTLINGTRILELSLRTAMAMLTSPSRTDKVCVAG